MSFVLCGRDVQRGEAPSSTAVPYKRAWKKPKKVLQKGTKGETNCMGGVGSQGRCIATHTPSDPGPFSFSRRRDPRRPDGQAHARSSWPPTPRAPPASPRTSAPSRRHVLAESSPECCSLYPTTRRYSVWFSRPPRMLPQKHRARRPAGSAAPPLRSPPPQLPSALAAALSAASSPAPPASRDQTQPRPRPGPGSRLSTPVKRQTRVGAQGLGLVQEAGRVLSTPPAAPCRPPPPRSPPRLQASPTLPKAIPSSQPLRPQILKS